MAISSISSWLVDDFNPKLAAWYATCREAVLPVRHRLKQERDEKDKVMRWALWTLRRMTTALIEPVMKSELFSEARPTRQPLWFSMGHVTCTQIDKRIDGSLYDKFKLAQDLRNMPTRWGGRYREMKTRSKCHAYAGHSGPILWIGAR